MTYRIDYKAPNPIDPERNLSMTLGDFSTEDEAVPLAEWALAEYGGDVDIVLLGGLGSPSQVVRTLSKPE